MIAKCALLKAPRIFWELNFTLNHSSLATLSFISFALKPLSPEFRTCYLSKRFLLSLLVIFNLTLLSRQHIDLPHS